MSNTSKINGFMHGMAFALSLVEELL